MAQEAKRGCGYRKVGGIYLVGSGLTASCDSLPLPLQYCKSCGQRIHVSRGMTEINPLELFGWHEHCTDILQGCYVCYPTADPAYINLVSSKFYPTPTDYLEESNAQGLSRRIPFIPKNFVAGKTVIYLAHVKACITHMPVVKQIEANTLPGYGQVFTEPNEIQTYKEKHTLGIFAAFIPERVEKLVWESELTDEVKTDLTKRGITPVAIKDGDTDHV